MSENIKAMVTDYLIRNGYDGLASEECGCGLDGLMPCDEPGDCRAAYHITRLTCGRTEPCGDDDEPCNYHAECDNGTPEGSGCYTTTKPEEATDA